MPDLLKTKLSEQPVAANLLPGDRLVLLRRAQDEADASKRNQTVGLAALQAWLAQSSGAGASRLTLGQAQALEGEGVSEQLYLITGTPTEAGQTLGTWNASGTSAAVYVPGYAGYFGQQGVLLDADGQPVAQVSVDVAAGTYTVIPDLAPTVAEHTQLLATLAARAANLYAHYADNTVAPFADLDSFLAAAGLHGGTLRLQGEATVLSVSVDNRGGWPAFWDAQGSTIVVPAGTVLKSSAAGAENLTFGNFYLDGGGLYRISNQLDQATPAGRASRLFDGFSNIPIDNPANVVVLDGGYYQKITGAGKYYLTGTVEVDDMTEASNVVDLRGGTGGGGTGTVKTVNGVAPDAAGNVMLASRDLFGYSQPKRDQVLGLFTSPTQFKAVDVALAGDTSTGLGSQIPDLTNGDLYTLVPDYDNRDAAGNGTPTWLRTSFS
jgi:hypothetical protein